MASSAATVDPGAIDPGFVDIARALVAQECPAWLDWPSALMGAGAGFILAIVCVAVAVVVIVVLDA